MNLLRHGAMDALFGGIRSPTVTVKAGAGLDPASTKVTDGPWSTGRCTMCVVGYAVRFDGFNCSLASAKYSGAELVR